ncbi:hypothetical protein [Saccharopolyspora rectivirgula]|uniref:hypothetical protein n=1 Tax=Saccharopolyspora rectivirgula TaxID=28042 RepID=UPI00040CA272|nr:hypothetical protein [Saccharopolyspora rectivirgula]
MTVNKTSADLVTGFERRARHGALPRSAAEREFGAEAVAESVAGGELLELWPGVLVLASNAEEPLTRASAALWRAGPQAVLSGLTAAAMHGCRAAAGREIHVTVPYDCERRSAPGLRVHQAWLRESDVLLLDGLRTFALDVALTELLCSGPDRIALACLEQALHQLGGAAEEFRARLGVRLALRRDRRGTRRAAALLELAWSRAPQLFPVPG